MKLTVEEFIKLRDIIYDKAGLYFETKKIYFVKKRVEKRMATLSIKEVIDYVSLLKYKDKVGLEMQALINLLTTNETYFFREDNQLSAFKSHCLPELLENKRSRNQRNLKIWSAGCSTGEEPYTLSILLKESLQDYHNWDIEIIASDIDTEVLATAKKGVYSPRSIRFVSPAILSKYFTLEGEDYRFSSFMKKQVIFRHLNLFNSLKMRMIRNVDFIFCRNVLIYFDDASRKAVMANFYDSLNPGGYIYLGHAESITRISTAFDLKRAAGLILYQKPGAPGVSNPLRGVKEV